MAEEFGDLLLQIVLNAQIANEQGEFSMVQVIKGIHDKIIRRHPHVFGEVQVDGVGGVLQNWEKLKEDERSENGEQEQGLLGGVPLSLPALVQAKEYQDRAARVGFDWPEIAGVLDKVNEEIREVRDATDEKELSVELGDLLFALVNLTRWKKIDAEAALRGANARFKRRFAYVEAGAKKLSRKVSEMTIDEMEILWQEAKTIKEE
jgi:tetrapyrrole methylase family protein/MazG family protein